MSLNFNIESIILLLFFIAPGFLFTRTYTAYRPRYYQAPNTFTQIVLAIVGSAIIHAVLLTVIALILLLVSGLNVGQNLYATDFFNLSASLASTTLLELARLIFGVILYLAISLVLARRFATFFGHRPPTARPRWWRLIMGDDPPEPSLLWHTVLQIEPLLLDLIPPHLHIQMRSGEYFEGDLDRMRLVGDEENTVELALRNIFHRPAPTVETPSPDLAALPNQVILLKSTDILWVTRNDIPQ
ncbi:MAG: DUF6338 family protein [Anaerolineae bacterium]|nr:DUF6338 family protein [Anaerolineae bacterium]